MNLELEKQTYFEVEKITGIRKYDYELDEISTDELYINSNLNINLYYCTIDGNNLEKKVQIPIEVLKDNEMENVSISIKSLRFDIIEGNGVSCNYVIDLYFNKKVEEKIEEAVPIKVLLDEDMEFIEENVIVTNSKKSQESFLDFFKNKKSNFYSLKCIKVMDEEELKELSTKHDIPLDDLYKGYDPKEGYVVFHAKTNSN